MKSTRKTTEILPAVRRYFREHSLPRPARLLVAVSGGADSSCLLAALWELREELGLALQAVHFGHGIRAESEGAEDAEFLRGLCARLGVPLAIEELPRHALKNDAREAKRSLEDMAREARYDFFLRQARLSGCELVALGHTRQDVRESQLMNFLRGYDPLHLDGMPLIRPPFIRPLVRVGRREVEAFLRERGLGWRADSTNDRIDYLRNRVRKLLLPALAETFPGYDAGLDNLAEKAVMLRRFVEKELDRKELWRDKGSFWEADRDDFLAADPLIRLLSIYRLYDRLGPGRGRRLAFSFLKPLLAGELGASGGLSGHAIRIEWSGSTIRLSPLLVGSRKRGYLFKVDKTMYGKVFDLFEFRVEERPPERRGEEGSAIPAGSVKIDLIRTRRPGDAVLAGRTKKKLKKIFNEMKIDESTRELLPVLQSGSEIIAVDGRPFKLPLIRSTPAGAGPSDRSGRYEVIATTISGELSEQSEQRRP